MSFNFGDIFKFIPVVQYVVAGIEQIHTDASGATKKQLAQEALGLAVGTAQSVLPGDAPLIQLSGQAVSTMIDNSVALFNALGMFTHKTNPSQAVAATP